MPNSESALVPQQFQAAWPPERWRDLTVLLAVSGGADSMALLRLAQGAALAHRGPGRVVVAHLNHALRGAESDGDEEFVRAACAALELPLEVHRLQPSPGAAGMEERARDARYDFLLRAAEAHGARYVATAHTADDQAETILHHVLRGTGLAGLAGMPRFRALSPALTLVRPLLGVRRADLRAYLADLRQDFREDRSNDDTAYTRNRLRHDLLPQLAGEYNPTVVEALVRLGRLAGETREFVDAQVAPLVDRAVRVIPSRGRVELDVHALAREPRLLVREVLIAAWQSADWPQGDMTFGHWEELAEMIFDPAPRKWMFPGAILAERTERELVLSRAISP